ncbi:hypothetical protein PISMIDRAFT_15862 [Pisolithus microcarpus 441]|uniref:Uncharacterized protein n=1 Tax=Pisolithus microcarpus 441 TaxID=765257 RepID=A0A0C9YI60_9AGAM|nr:hypothetical protein PISMIDRAFT_15862 [Pisolithus microcarpus 441]
MATRLDGRGITSPPPQARRTPDRPGLTDGPGVGERQREERSEWVVDQRGPSFSSSAGVLVEWMGEGYGGAAGEIESEHRVDDDGMEGSGRKGRGGVDCIV